MQQQCWRPQGFVSSTPRLAPLRLLGEARGMVESMVEASSGPSGLNRRQEARRRNVLSGVLSNRI